MQVVEGLANSAVTLNWDWVVVILVLFAGVLLLMLHSRQQGYRMAARLTADLQRERDLAVASDQKSTAILASIGDAVFAIDAQRHIQVFNAAAERLSGYSSKEALGRPYEEILKFEAEGSGKVNKTFITQALAGKITTLTAPTVLIRKDGGRVPIADSAAPILDAKDHIQGAIIVFRDVSKEYDLDKAKSEFVSLASHQLRTPLSAINWYSEMLLSGDAGEMNTKQHDFLVEIFEGNQRMIELVDSLLDVSRLEVGKLPNRPVATDLAELVGRVEKEFATNIANRHLILTKDIADLPRVTADPRQLRMVIQNLVSNAVKYTPDRGKIHLVLRPATPDDMKAAGRHGAEPYWFFSVQDTGYGIPKIQQARIFNKLFRADNVRTLNVNGTGLGLYIVKEVVEKMGGLVWFESLESAGTTFFVIAPVHHRGGQ
jgi:PAS domain S-box-containing protein